MDRFLIITIFALIISILGVFGFPTIVKWLIRRLFKPSIPIYVDIPESGHIKWDDIRNKGIKMKNKSTKRFHLHPIFIVNRNMDYKSKEMNKMYITDFRDGYHIHKMRPKFVEMHAPSNPNSQSSHIFPLAKPDEDFELTVVAKPKVEPSEFGLPGFIDSVYLNPSYKTYHVSVD